MSDKLDIIIDELERAGKVAKMFENAGLNRKDNAPIFELIVRRVLSRTKEEDK